MGKRLLLAGTMVAALSAAAPAAWADGDPASDVLATQALFLPQDAGIPAQQQERLASLLATGQRRGYPIRAALIGSPSDLGSVAALWRQPQTYARFLGQELQPVYRGPVLVAMPNGFGLFIPSGAGPSQSAALARIPAAQSPSQLATATSLAVRRLAAAAGHPLPASGAGAGARAGSSSLVPWLVFAAGLGLVGLAWWASLRAQPLRGRPGGTAGA
jgi:hypothetical protein